MRDKLFACLAGSVAVAAVYAASAADIPSEAPAVVVAQVWDGVYFGINGGYSWGRWDTTGTTAVFPGAGGLVTDYSPHVDGWLFGGQVGANWQVGRHWLVGLEGDIQWTGERASTDASSATGRIAERGNDFNDIFTTVTSASWKFPWFATVRGRVGVLPDPEFLLYATGGVAVGSFTYEVSTATTCAQFSPGSAGTIPTGAPCIPAAGTPPVGASSQSESQIRWGYVFGGGIEKRFGPHWSVRTEYLYLDFGSFTFLSGTGLDASVRLRDHIARAGVNYRFPP